MATLAVTATPQPLSLPPGTPITVSADCQIGTTSGGASSGPTIKSGFWTWPGSFNGTGLITYFVVTATTANLTYPS